MAWRVPRRGVPFRAMVDKRASEVLFTVEARPDTEERCLSTGRLELGHRVRVQDWPKDVLLCEKAGQRWACIGVMRDANPNGTQLTFRRYDRFRSEVVLWEGKRASAIWGLEGPDAGFGPSSYRLIRRKTFERVLLAAGASKSPKDAARAFARKASERFRQEWGMEVRRAYKSGAHPNLDSELEKLAGRGAMFSTEGRGKAAKLRNYELLGTGAFPDAAVVWPFRCAVEYDRQPNPTNSSHLKTTLLKTAAHVLSGAYDAAVHVFLFQDACAWNAGSYELDVQVSEIEHLPTRQFLSNLEDQGVFLAACFPRTQRGRRSGA